MTTHTATGWLTVRDGRHVLLPRFAPDQDPDYVSDEDARAFGVPLTLRPDVDHAKAAGWARVSGIWDGSTFTVGQLGAPKFNDSFAPAPVIVPTAHRDRPRHDELSQTIEGELLASGAIVSRRYLQSSDGSWGVVITALEPDSVRTRLTELHGDQLTLLQAEWSQAQYEAATDNLTEHLIPWALSVVVHQVNDDGVGRIIASPRAITTEIEHWHHTQPVGLIELRPLIQPTA